MGALTLLIRVPSWRISLIDADEFAFILAAREILHGHLPYTTFFDIKPLGSSVLLAFAMTVFGQTLVAVRLFGAACVLVASLCLYETVRFLTGRQNEAVASATLYIAFTVLFHGLATMTEIVLAPFTCAGVAILARYIARPSGSSRLTLVILVAGLAFGLAIWIKTVPILAAAVLGGGALLYRLMTRRSSVRVVVLDGLGFSAGVVLPVAVTVAVYARVGALPEFIYANYGFMHTYVQKPPLLVAAVKFVTVLVQMWPLVLAAMIGAALDARDLLARRPLGILAVGSYLWLGAETVASVAPLQMYPHYFLMILPPLCVLTGRCVARGVALMVAPGKLATGFAALTAAVMLVPVLPTEWGNAVTLVGRPDAQRESARVIQGLMPADDRSLFVLSYDFMADYFYTGASLPSRVAIPAHLFGPQSGVSDADPDATLRSILARSPQIILMDKETYERDVPQAARTVIDQKLACCYREAAAMPEFWFIDPGTYHIRDVRVFQRAGG